MANNKIKLTQIQDDRTWHDMKASRALGTTYTNNKDYPIEISMSIDHPSSTSGRQTRLIISGVIVAETYNVSTTNNIRTIIPVSATVPAGANYTMNIVGGSPAIWEWAELY